jgi:hypothetical protein
MNTAAPPADSDAGLASAVSAAPALLQAAAVACENCGAAVPQKYCGVCGQRVEPPIHSLRHFAKVAAEDLTHADSRLWRTLGALLFKPGFLTREFLRGRRARYLPPIRLYLVLSVVFFVWASASATHNQFRVLQFDPATKAAPKVAVPPGAHPKTNIMDTLPGESAEQRSQRICSQISYGGPWPQRLAAPFHRTCLAATADYGRPLTESFLHNLPRAMFLFLPLLAGVMMLMYWRPRHYYVEHLLLLVHDHAFVFLVIIISWILHALLPFARGLLNTAVTFYIAWYVYRSVRVMYGQGRWLTLGKLMLLSLVYMVSGLLLALLTMGYSALTM